MLAEIGPARNLLRLLWAKATVAVMQQFSSYRGQTGHAADIVNVSSLMWWTVPAPGNEVP
jgi:hypothetical protein